MKENIDGVLRWDTNSGRRIDGGDKFRWPHVV